MVPAKDALNRHAIDLALEQLSDWRYRLGGLHAVFRAPSSRVALKLVEAIGDLAEEQVHHPDVDWRYARVFVRCTSHDAGREVTARDVRAAIAISDAAGQLGAEPEPVLSRTVEIAIDTEDPERLTEFWCAALGYRRGRSGDVLDPYGRNPTIWFQQTPLPHSSRLHLDVHGGLRELGPVLERTGAAGRLVDDSHAPSFTVFADPDGNRVCLCSEAGRGPIPQEDAPEEEPGDGPVSGGLQ
jgi:4a-hydroxytetrahydrobiopterin dehydratase